MKPFKPSFLAGAFRLAMTVCAGALVLSAAAQAQLSIKLTGPDGKTIAMSGRNAARGDETLILFDSSFGPSTRTNPYGVEVIAVPSSTRTDVPDGKVYQVVGRSSVWECAKNKSLTCGNAAIPTNGIVLSATGSLRDYLVNLKPGDTLTIQQEWFQQTKAHLNVINPTIANNPAGSGFPGYRASNQIVVYNTGYGRPSTGTNEFGFEVTVRNGIVVAQEGSDSSIPADGYVLSGHGKGRSWLIANAPIGAKMEVSPDGKTLFATIDFGAYTYQFDQNWAQSPCADGSLSDNASASLTCKAIQDRREQAVRLFQNGQTNLAAATIQEALDGMHRQMWLSYKAFPANTLRGAWHRPVEKTPAAVGQTLDTLKAAGLNTVFLETYFHGYTIFPSKTFEAYGLPVENPKFAGTDLLQVWVEEAHKRNMKIHTWFQAFYGGTNAYLPPGPILAKYPSWANVQFSALVEQPPLQPLVSAAALPLKPGSIKADAPNQPPVEPYIPHKSPDKPVPSTLELGGYFLDPANPQVQKFLTALTEEIVTRYNVDGFQLDYIRYPASFPSDRFSYRKTTWGYTDLARNAFKAQYGIDPVDIDPKNPQYATLWKSWNDYKTAQINSFVHHVTDDIRQKRPDLKISAAVFPEADSALLLKHQDWRTWAKNGWVDFFAPMTLTSAIKVVDRDTRYMINVTDGKVPVYSGIFGPFNDNSAEHVLNQIDTAKQAGASGYVLFDTAHMSPRLLEALKVIQNPPQQTVVPLTHPPVVVEPVKQKKSHWWNRW